MSKIGAATAFFSFRVFYKNFGGGKLVETLFFLLIESFFTFAAVVDYLLMLDNLTECGLMALRKHKTIFGSFFPIFRYIFCQFFLKFDQFC